MSIEILFIIAIVLLAVEAVTPTLGILGFCGFLAFLGGLGLMMHEGVTEFYGLSLEMTAAIGGTVFLIFAVGSVFVIRSLKKNVETGIEAMVGQTAEVVSWKNDGGQVLFEGENWRATSSDELSKGDNVRIAECKNMTLTVKKDT